MFVSGCKFSTYGSTPYASCKTMSRTGESSSSEMSSIYSNAYLTLAATKSPDAHGGCYSIASADVEAREIMPYGVFVRKSWRHVPHIMARLTGHEDEHGL